MRVLLPCVLFAACAATASAAPIFVEHTEYLGPPACGPSDTGCYTNYLQIADLDGDGKLDVLFPNAKGYFSKVNPAEPLVWLHNDGGFSFSDASASFGGGFSGWLRQVAIGDVDGDGDLDVYAPSAWQDADALFVNDGSGGFTDQAATRMGGATSHAGATRFADVDGDGDLDLFVANWGQPNPQGNDWSVDLWVNDGAGHFTKDDSRLPTGTFFQSGTPVDVDVTDVDGDFDLDLLIDRHDQDPELWKNDGTGQFSDAGTIPVPGGLHYNPVFCDVDGDGDLDLFVDNAPAFGANESLFLNDGAGNFTASTGLSAVGDAGSDDNGVACIDVNGDGVLDAAVASLSGSERILINGGMGTFTLSPDGFPPVSDSTLWFDFGDLDGDGRLDAVTGQGESGDWTNRLYVGSNGMAADSHAPLFRKVQSFAAPGDGVAVTFRFAVVDGATTDTGPRLTDAHVAFAVGGGANQTAPARFAGGDLFQATIPGEPKGSSISWQVCATDRAGNQNCSPSKSYTVTGTVTPPGGNNACSCDLGGDASPLAAMLLSLAAALAALRIRSSLREGAGGSRDPQASLPSG